MRIFEEGNWEHSKRVCPICKTKEKGKVVLIPIVGKQSGNNCEAVQVHLNCLGGLWLDEENKVIYQKI